MTKTTNECEVNQQALPPIFLGLPVWQDPSWPVHWFQSSSTRQQQLRTYANKLNSVEGNTTFYSLPHADAVARWAGETGDGFSFTFKFHQHISHSEALDAQLPAAVEQLTLLSALGNKLGSIMLQLPASFSPARLPSLSAFLEGLPKTYRVAVEVRHPAFFQKGEAEQRLNRLLMEHQADRIIMDTRALFTGPSTSALVADVRTKKPRVPVNVIATGRAPIVRFVGNDNEQDNLRCLIPWFSKVHQWREEGRTPYVFLHRPDNKDAPWLAQLFITHYNQRYPEFALPDIGLAAQPSQDALF
ncbi:DUF72 domain-containing protein [Alteromonas sp. ASW11-19]|uniref:DUF72 domain-containing protein n=1 Tax=Alteromonas salexigens TaxID=2982530 RepID=A0ABT2VPH5_9ALTE|nr:DUF72 domain-containing protein [Alteromonas salexigens]MCU7555213.1 DUF72 domain-containing protein [Alteromonas salexigens]